jgi:leucyl aminopeptidase
MRIGCLSADIRKVKADMVVTTLFEGEKRPGGVSASLDAAVGGAVSAAVAAGDFTGKAGETFFLRPAKGVSSPRVLVVGLGKRDRFTPDWHPEPICGNLSPRWGWLSLWHRYPGARAPG